MPIFGGGGSITFSTEGIKVCAEGGVGTPGGSFGFEFGSDVTSGPKGASLDFNSEVSASIENPLITGGLGLSSGINLYDPEKGKIKRINVLTPSTHHLLSSAHTHTQYIKCT